MKIASLSLGKTEKPESERFAPFMTFLKFVIPGFKEAYDQKMALQNYDAKMKAQYRIRVPLLEAPRSIFNLPYTTENNKPKKQLISKKLFGGKNEKLPTAPKAEVRYANSRRVYPDDLMFKYSQTYINGTTNGVMLNTPYTTIPAYITQQVIGNDTIYRETPDLKRFRLRGFPITRQASNTDQDRSEYNTLKGRFNKAWGIAKHLFGTTKGGIQPSDNTRVASGRPLVILNKIPWGAGKGPAGEGPMRLFNDPYVNMGLMAMGPMVGRSKPGETPPLHINGVKLAPSTLQDIMNYLRLSPKTSEAPRVMGLGVRSLSRMSGKSPEEVIRTMSLKFGEPQTYPKAFDNYESAYGWTFENPDHYRLALLLFNLK